MMAIRQAGLDDLDAIIALMKNGHNPTLSEIHSSHLAEKLSDERSTHFVAVDDKSIVGYAKIKKYAKHRAHFGSLVVHDKHREKGIATALTRARIAYLQEDGFEGIVSSDALTYHYYSQRQLSANGFSPTHVLIGDIVDHGIGPETTIGFTRLLLGTEPQRPALYLPPEYHTIAAHVLAPFGNFALAETAHTVISERTQRFVQSEQYRKPNRTFEINLFEETAPAEIALLKKDGFTFAGFYPIPYEGNLLVMANMHRIKQDTFNKKKMCIIPAAQPIFDLVWNEYVSAETVK